MAHAENFKQVLLGIRLETKLYNDYINGGGIFLLNSLCGVMQERNFDTMKLNNLINNLIHNNHNRQNIHWNLFRELNITQLEFIRDLLQ